MSDESMRVSQEERERVVERLREHAGEGRLELTELEQRVEAALAARTVRDLRGLTADLPGPPATRRRSAGAAGRLGSARAFLPLLAGIAILVAAPEGFAWVGWTVIGWWFFAGLPATGLGFAGCGHAKRRRSRPTPAV